VILVNRRDKNSRVWHDS
jgi:hypothetical protein